MLRSDDEARSFEPIEGPQLMSCIDEDAEPPHDALLCGRYAEGENGIASVDPVSHALRSWFDFTEVTNPVSCDPASETAQTCVFLWHDWLKEIFPTLDAGVADDAGSDASAPTMDAGSSVDASTNAPETGLAPASDSGGCNAIRVSSTLSSYASVGAATLIQLVLVAWRRRRFAARRRTA